MSAVKKVFALSSVVVVFVLTISEVASGQG